MKIKLILLVLVLFFLAGCNDSNEDKKNIALVKPDGDIVTIVSIDGCEYIVNLTAYGFKIFTHKGNCTNSIHVYNKEKKND